MSTQAPTIVLVHGAFAESASWNPVIERLYHHGTPMVAGHHHHFRDVVAVANPLRSLTGDAEYVRDVLRSIEGPIVLVGHSYGGMVITQAAAGCDSVVALVYVAAFTPTTASPRSSCRRCSPEAPSATPSPRIRSPPAATRSPSGTSSSTTSSPPTSPPALLHSWPRHSARPPLAALSEGLPTDRPAWKDIPSWFVYGEQDLTSRRHWSDSRPSAPAPERTRQVAGGSHAISVSNPDAVADTILDAVAASKSPVPVTAS